jgi:hypothetical protein
VILRSKQRLGLLHGNIDFQPITTLGQCDSSIFDATLSEPRLDGGESLDRRRECVRDLVSLAALSINRDVLGTFSIVQCLP